MNLVHRMWCLPEPCGAFWKLSGGLRRASGGGEGVPPITEDHLLIYSEHARSRLGPADLIATRMPPGYRMGNG